MCKVGNIDEKEEEKKTIIDSTVSQQKFIKLILNLHLFATRRRV